MTRITIKCPETWWSQCDWIEQNCRDWEDQTCWAAWQIGHDYIYFLLPDDDAAAFKLAFGDK
jgi:hypothetical protein